MKNIFLEKLYTKSGGKTSSHLSLKKNQNWGYQQPEILNTVCFC